MGTESLAEFELLVMLASLRLGPSRAHALSIADDIEERTGLPVRRTKVSNALRRLEEKGFISTVVGDPLPGPGARVPQQLVRVEDDGAAAVRATTEGILAMLRQMKMGDA